jgi:hypothetical protein
VEYAASNDGLLLCLCFSSEAPSSLLAHCPVVVSEPLKRIRRLVAGYAGGDQKRALAELKEQLAGGWTDDQQAHACY